MIVKSASKSLLSPATKGALIGMALQLSFGTSLTAFAGEQPLLNSTLPLPDIGQLKSDRSISEVSLPSRPQASLSGRDNATVVAMRFFGKKNQADSAASEKGAKASAPVASETKAEDKGEPLTAGDSTLRPSITGNESATTNAAADVSAPLRPKLETNSSWLEDKPGDSSSLQSKKSKGTLPAIRDIMMMPPLSESTPVKADGAAASAQAPAASTQVSTPTPGATPNESLSSSTPKVQAASSDDPAKPVDATAVSDSSNATTGPKPVTLAILPSPVAAPPAASIAGRATIFIDNDEAVEQEETIQYEELALDDATKSKVKAGARFPIVITSEITSRTAKTGDPVHGRLKFDLKIGDRLIATKGSVVRGHLNYALKARTPLASMVSTERFYRNSGCLGITFDEIVSHKGEHIPLVAEPARSALYVKNKAEGRVLGINHKGQITGPWSQQLQYKAVRVGMNFAMAPLGAMTFGAMPVALGVMGAVNPSFAFMRPVGLNVRHRRIKGFAWGFLSGIPGSWLIEDTTVKGQEAIIKPGDEFLAELRQEFTGEPGTEAEMLGGADVKVQGEIVGQKGAKKKSKKAK